MTQILRTIGGGLWERGNCLRSRRGSPAALTLMSVVLFLAVIPAAAVAQSQLAAPPPIRSSIDINGVDLTTGAFTVSSQEVVVGQPGTGGLIYSRTFYKDGWRDNYIGTIKSSGTTYTVSMGGGSETFVLSSGVYASDQDLGSSLTYNSGTQVYTYITKDGMVALFSKSLAETSPLEANEGKISSVTMPAGEKLTFTYKAVTISSVVYNRLQSVTNNLGYQLKFEYSLNTPTTTGDLPAFRLVTKVTGLNNAVDYCDPTADSCSYSQAWPNATYATPGDNSMARTVTDSLSQVTRYTYDSSGRVVGIRLPSASSDTATLTYDSSSRVTVFSNGTSSWTYGYSDASGMRTTVATDPLTHTRTLVSEIASGLVSTDTDGVGRTTSFTYDSSGRLTRVTSPAGDYVEYAYDARGNITTTTRVAASGSGLSNIVTSASYDSSCTYPVKCNKPNSTTDATGQVTNYTYADSTHGGLLTTTAPAASGGGTRPQTRITYTALYAYYKNSSGSIVAAPTPVYRATSVSGCVSGSSCSAASTEVVSTVTYGSTGTANNLLATAISSGSGDGALVATTTLTWDAIGNRLTVDGPLSGSADVTRYRYDAGRQLVGVVGPDPDGAGSLTFRAQRNTYDASGRLVSVENGTVTAQTDAAWASMTVLDQATITFDGLGRPTKKELVAGGVAQSVLQSSYDASNRLDCVAVRMNPSVFASLPSSACTLGTTGSNGPDRITKYAYNAADQVTKVTVAYGTASQADEATFTFNSLGLPATISDALGSLTTYEYDGFGRLRKVRYPIAATRTSSSTTDYEELTYDAYGRISQRRRRDGSVFGLSYDQLSRPTALDAPSGMNDISFTYDLLGRPLSVGYSGNTLTMVWDALARQTSVTGPLGTISYQYDLAGRRTRMTWPDGFYITYDYDVLGEMTAERENGATSGAGVLATFEYDNLGRRISFTRGNGAVTSYGYDSVSRLTSLTNDLASTGSDQTYTFTYAPNFQILTRGGSNSSFALAAPANANRTYGSNGLNQLTASGSLNLTYSSAGNLTSDGVNSYGYDAANRLTSASGVSLSYDPLGRLYEVAASATSRFAYDGVNLIGEYNTSGTLLRRYVHGPGVDEPIVWYEGSGTTDRRWLVADQLGSTVAVTDASGAAIAINKYDEYGLPGSSNLGRFQYTGQAWISEVGLYYYKARVYSPALGRFLQTDPAGYGGGMNLYAYVQNDPTNNRDPSGLVPCHDQVRRPVVADAPSGDTEVCGLIITAPKKPKYACDEDYFCQNPGLEGLLTLVALQNAPTAEDLDLRGPVGVDDQATRCERLHRANEQLRQYLPGWYSGARWDDPETLRQDLNRYTRELEGDAAFNSDGANILAAAMDVGLLLAAPPVGAAWTGAHAAATVVVSIDHWAKENYPAIIALRLAELEECGD